MKRFIRNQSFSRLARFSVP